MSYISTLEGRVTYDSTEAFETAVENLESHGFKSMVELKPDKCEILLNIGTYRNLGRNLELLLDTASGGGVVGVSSEVNWHGFVATPETEEEFDLENWAARNGFETSRPEQENFETEDDWWDEYVDWQSEVGSAFMEENSHYL
jgi:hypothetical protein